MLWLPSTAADHSAPVRHIPTGDAAAKPELSQRASVDASKR
jgi:hypothetical protein